MTIIGLALAACAAPGRPAGASEYQPLAEAECGALLERFAETVRSEASMADAPLTSLPGAGGTACTLSATANAAQAGSWNSTAERLSTMLVEQGWAGDQQLIQADGPSGSVTGFRKGDSIAVLSTRLTDDTTGRCPQDQPLAACDLPPEQQYYDVTLALATAR